MPRQIQVGPAPWASCTKNRFFYFLFYWFAQLGRNGIMILLLQHSWTNSASKEHLSNLAVGVPHIYSPLVIKYSVVLVWRRKTLNVSISIQM